jgi:hypothetical protein
MYCKKRKRLSPFCLLIADRSLSRRNRPRVVLAVMVIYGCRDGGSLATRLDLDKLGQHFPEGVCPVQERCFSFIDRASTDDEFLDLIHFCCCCQFLYLFSNAFRCDIFYGVDGPVFGECQDALVTVIAGVARVVVR